MNQPTKTFRVEFHYGTVDGASGPTIIKHATAANPVAAIRTARKLVHPILLSGRDTVTIVSASVSRI